jgi:phytoene dehydrogenase-like protein
MKGYLHLCRKVSDLGKKVIIIGAGIAGLAAGCYAQMNGYDTHIYEMHDKAGGLCTSWKRNGYTMDGSLHWLTGTAPGNKFYTLWQELGVIPGKNIIYSDEYLQLIDTDGRTFHLYTNIDRLEKHLHEFAPADAIVTDELITALRAMTKLDLPGLKAPELCGPLDQIKMMLGVRPVMGTMSKYSSMSIGQFAEKFSDPLIRYALKNAFLVDLPMTAFLVTMAWFHNKWQGYPAGGSLDFSRGIEKRYVELGGKIRYKAKVGKILVENDRAAGVKLSDGSEYRADIVLSACDGHSTIFGMLEGKFVNDEIKKYYASFPVFPSGIQVSLGFDQDLSGEPETQMILLEKPFVAAGRSTDHIFFKHYCRDSTMAPPGKSVVTVYFVADYAFWKTLGEDRARYEAEKAKFSGFAIAGLDRRYMGISQRLEAVDVATPLTYERYTGNWQGSYMGWMNSSKPGLIVGKRLPGLKNFYMAGIWTQVGGGVPAAALTARGAVEIMCKDDGKKFVTVMP